MWLDRLLGETINELPASVEPGRYCIQSSGKNFNGHTQAFSGVLVSDGSEQCQLGHDVHEFVSPNKSILSKAELFSRAIESFDTNGGMSDQLCSPLMPAAIIDEQSHLLPFEKKLYDVVNKGHLHYISQRPRLDLYYEEEVTDIARAKRLAKGALVHLASHSECWQRQTLNGVIPKKVLARFSQDDYNTYENRIYARLLDKIELHLYRRIDTLKQIQATLSQALEFYEATDLNHRLTADICRLWGQTFDEEATSNASEVLVETLKILEYLFRMIVGLKQAGLYLQVHRNAQVGGAVYLTNILSHDPHYRHLAILWDLMNKAQVNGRATPEEVYKQNLFLTYTYSLYAGLTLRHALKPYMAGQDEAVWAGRKLQLKQTGLDWQLFSSEQVAGSESKLLLTVVPWLGFTKRPDDALQCKDKKNNSSYVIAWPAIGAVTSQSAMEENWIALSPFDLYCVERFGQLVDRTLYQQLLQHYSKPLERVPSQVMRLVFNKIGPAIYANDIKHQVVIREVLSDEIYAELKEALISANARQQAAMLDLRQQEIMAIQNCPVCYATVRLRSQEPAGFRASCSNCSTERYLREQGDKLVFEQKMDGTIDFLTTGRRTLSLCWGAGSSND